VLAATYTVSTNTLNLVMSEACQVASLLSAGLFQYTRSDLSRRRNASQGWTSASTKSLSTSSLAGSGSSGQTLAYTGLGAVFATATGSNLANFSGFPCLEI